MMFETLADSGDLTRTPMVWTALNWCAAMADLALVSALKKHIGEPHDTMLILILLEAWFI